MSTLLTLAAGWIGHCSAVTAWASACHVDVRLADRHRIVFIDVFVHVALVKQFNNISILNSLEVYAQTSDLVRL